MDPSEHYQKLAHHEIGWWKAHHRKDGPRLTDEMAKLYVLQFNISYQHAIEAVTYRVKATKEHDIAEDLEDKGNQTQSDIHWKKAEELLVQHFRILDAHSKKGKK